MNSGHNFSSPRRLRINDLDNQCVAVEPMEAFRVFGGLGFGVEVLGFTSTCTPSCLAPGKSARCGKGAQES